jgi:hypothetical protein
MSAVRRESFNGRDSFAGGIGCGEAAGSNRLAIDMDSACPALADAATELGSRQAKMITNHPEQGCFRIRIDGMSRTVEVEIERHTVPPLNPGIVSEKLEIP